MMETPKEFLEGYDPQIKEVGYDNYSYTPQQVIDRLEAYRKELIKESDCLPCVSVSLFNEALRVLRDLAEHQNGAPLIRHEEEYNKTMAEVWDFLEANET